MTAMRERYGIEGIVYLGVLALGMTLTIGFAAFGFVSARDARNQSDATTRLVERVCASASQAYVDSNRHVRHPLKELLLDAAYARQIAARTEIGARSRVDAATAEKYKLLASMVTDLPRLNC